MINKVDQADWGYVPLDPDPDFDAEHNKKVIDATVRKNEINRKRIKREREKQIAERSSAVASYVKHVQKNKSNATPEDYFGRKYLARLRGEEIVEKLKKYVKEQKGSQKTKV